MAQVITPTERGHRLALRLIRNRRGAITVEFGFVATLLIALSIAGYDFGRLAIAQARISSAARAGAQYGIQDLVNANDSDGMVEAARRDASDEDERLTISAGQFCECPGAAGEVACSGTCPDGGSPALYASVTVADSVDLLMAYPGIASPVSLSAATQIRVR